jgi:hypothetical protein
MPDDRWQFERWLQLLLLLAVGSLLFFRNNALILWLTWYGENNYFKNYLTQKMFCFLCFADLLSIKGAWLYRVHRGVGTLEAGHAYARHAFNLDDLNN